MTGKMNFNQLTALRYLLEEKNVSRAAKRAFVSQPAMSKTLQNLRALTGDALLIRLGNDMVISPYAECLLNKLIPALNQLDEVMERKQFEPGKSQHTFTLASSDYFSNYVLPPIFTALNQQAPKAKFRVLNWSEKKTKALASGNIDIAAAAFLTPPALPEAVKSTLFGEDHLVCVMARNHPLARLPLSLESYSQSSHICVSGDSEKSSIMELCLQQLNHDYAVTLSVPYYTAAFEIIQNSDCLLTVPVHIAGKMAKDFNIIFTELPFKSPKISYYLLWPRLKEDDEPGLWLRSELHWQMSRDFECSKTQGLNRLSGQKLAS
ncbi:LysR family transcriptional regulator [Thalassomonas sp. RHCl1]|uniref:LysR family transcriptional regulator n=1 Tax=Thalassomonas sp. RHCl1 TaxID=2995320 RepID=UPI00248A9920|nr:LysR family transcriptional regulator [Thalassomonas sp. RHCl1]